MSGFWSFINSRKNLSLLAWVSGIATVIAGLLAVVVYFFPPKLDGGEGKGGVTASHGGVSVGGNVTNSTIKTSPDAGGDSQPQGH